MNNVNKIITETANDLGIEAVGVTDILDYSYLKDFFIERANNNYDNEFEEKDMNKRFDVKKLFPDCKSIIAVGIPYAEGYKKIDVKDKGLLSVVSYGLDYHMKINNLLLNFVQKIKKYINFEYKIIVDTSPLIDREICKNAGIGMYGKNTLLINHNYGSFMNLGYILTDLEIESNNYVQNLDICKECDICLNNCPNNAILKEGRVDTKRCVSFLTQTKTYIPLEYRKNMSNQIYGCDVCQLSCPKNKKNAERKNANDYTQLMVDFNEIMNISNADFNKKYGLISGSWRGKNVWKRNAIISIANLDIKSMYDKLKYELENPSEMIRIYAAWSLLMLNKQKGTDLLHSYLKYENDIIEQEYKKLLMEVI